MKKLIKITLSILIVLIVTLVAVPYFFKDDIEKFIKEEVNNSVNAKIDYSNLDLSLFSDFPNLHVKIENISVDGVQEFENIRLAEIDKFTMSLNAKKLFIDKDLEIKKIGLDGANFIIKVLKNGKANYDIAKPSRDTVVSKDEFSIKLQSYSLKNTNITYDDASMGLHMRIKQMQHQGKGAFSSKDYRLYTSTEMDTLDVIFDNVHYLNNVKSSINADMLIENEFSKYTLSDVTAKLNNLELVSNMMFELKDDDINMDIKYETKDNSLKKLLSLIPKAYMPDLQGVKANGTAVLKGFAKGTYNDKNFPAFGVDFKVANGHVQYPDLPESIDKMNIVTKVDFPGGSNLDKTIIDMPVIKFDIAGNTSNGKLRIKNPMSNPYIKTNFKSKVDLSKVQQAVKLANISKLKGLLDADFALDGSVSNIENQAFDKFKASGYFNLKDMEMVSDSLPYPINISLAEVQVTPQNLNVKRFDSKVGESDFHLTGTIDNYITYFLKKDKVLKADFNLHSNYLNMNEFMSGDESTQSTDSTATGIIKIPKNIDVVFKADADKMQYEDLNLKDVKGKITVKNEVAQIESVLLKTLQGNITMKGKYDSSGKKAKSDLNLSMEKMSLASSAERLTLLKTYAPVMKRLHGNFFSDFNMAVDLDNKMQPVLSSIDAKGSFKTGQLNIAGIGVIQKIGNMLKMNELQQAKVDNIKAQFEIVKGKLHVKPFGFKINGMKSGLQGSVGLDQKINFILDMDIPRSKLGSKANDILEGLVGKLDKLGLKAGLGDLIKMKFKITGDYNNPKIVPIISGTEGSSVKEVITQAVEEKVEEVVDDAKEKARAEAQKKADEIMKKAQKQTDLLIAEAKKAGDKIKAEAKKQGDDLIKKAGNDPFKKLAAQTLAKQLNKEADKKAKKLVNVAQNKANLILKNAKEKSDKLIQETGK